MAQQSHSHSGNTEILLRKKLILNKSHTFTPKNDIVSRGKPIKSIFMAISLKWPIVVFIVFSAISLSPTRAEAWSFASILESLSNNSPKTSEVSKTDQNSQNIPLLQSSVNFDLLAAKGDGDIITVGDEALVSENGPSGTLADISDTANTGQISKYMVRKGDSLGSIAKMFGVSQNTIIWANDVTASTIKEGQILLILPVSGTVHTVVKGDTLKSIAKKYKADSNEILQFNDLDKDAPLAVGDSIIIPDGEGAAKVSAPRINTNEPFRGGSGPNYAGYYIRPLIGGVKTQGLHGYNAVDIGTPVGTPLLAAAAGEVIISKSSGYNGGYGKYVVIAHYNGTQTLYGHMSNPYVVVGQKVVQGQVIGLSGNTGKSTGPHVHFEVRGAVNPFQ